MSDGTYNFDRFLRYDELTAWLRQLAAEHPGLVEIESYGTSHEGRNLWLVTVTDPETGPHHEKPAHWIDASIHAVELTACVAACHVIHHLVSGYRTGDPAVTEALRTRTFYIVPRVNPDGSEWVLADRPRFRRSSTRAWPWTDGHRWPGVEVDDVDGDGRILQMRFPDPDGAWMPHPEVDRLMVPVPPAGPPPGTPRYRLLTESTGHDLDGFTIPTPRPVEGLDLNRNYPAGWDNRVSGAGDHPLSEPEIEALVKAMAARPNICGFNAFHTHGGVLLRPSSTKADSALPPFDVWAWKQLGEVGADLTGYPVHSVYEDFTWDKSSTMSGASDDFAYEHLGVYGWTTEFWDVIEAATGTKMSTHFWYTGPTSDELLAVLRWFDENDPTAYVDWYEFNHPQLGPVELGGWNDLTSWTNPPAGRLRDVATTGHAEFAVHQAMCSPRIEIRRITATPLADDGLWEITVGVANTGWLGTTVTALAAQNDLVRPLTIEIGGDGAEVRGPARVQAGQLDGRAAIGFRGSHDGTPDRTLVRFLVTIDGDTELTITASHLRAGTARETITLHHDI